MSTRKKYVIANWKTHPRTLKEAITIFKKIIKNMPRAQKMSVGICPPDLFIMPLQKTYRGTRILWGGQNSAQYIDGSHTGEVLPNMLKAAGATYVILGHSERRADGETSAVVAQKIQFALKAGLVPVICFGERERDFEGAYLNVLAQQLHKTLDGVTPAQLKKCILAYEPVWAIGKTADEALTQDKLHQTVIYIRKILVEMYSRGTGMAVSLLYGGSVEPDNAADLIADVDGYLVGHAGLVPDDLVAIIQSVQKNS